MGVFRSWLVLASALAPLSLAFGYGDGISGYSGVALSCTACHSGGVAPTVSIVGPTTVAPGSTTSYLFRISGGQNKFGGLDLSTTAGSLISGAGSTLLSGEVTHSAGKAAVSGVVEFPFSFKAPAVAGLVTFTGAGLSSDGSGRSGDGTAVKSFVVTVMAAPAPSPSPSPTPSPTPTSPPNMAPAANPGGPYAAVLGDQIQFDGSRSLDSDGSVASYVWSFGEEPMGSGSSRYTLT